ncbi:DUF1573 domain-containing protein [Fulvivirga sp. 29W222]|uniref:DUF1573 domain-containing protein n=1 Tax=Fulvivirga marina TaxID=2494733 RepID=A0A937FWX2_9BACT|nr:DUF1573 domain-containing protein [Fulvivirga marina]
MPLIISIAKSSCGCTVSAYSKDPIIPCESGEITASYHAKKNGSFLKSVTVTPNARDNVVVPYLKGKARECCYIS